MPAPQLFSALRGALYFNGAGLTWPMLVLFGWLVAGLALLGIAGLVPSRRAVASAPTVAPAH
jgi:hypothetical protein